MTSHLRSGLSYFLALLFGPLFFFAAAAGAGRCETVSTGVIMAGTRYATTYLIKKGDKPGPTIVVIGGVHGDEIAGYRAAEQLVHWNITSGTLWILPDAHKEAIRRNVRGYPGNMNNMFPGKRDGTDMERLAYQIFEMIRRAHPDLLLTLHESRDFHSVDPKRYGQTFCYDFAALNPEMQIALDSVNKGIEKKRDHFSLFVEAHPTCPTYQAWVQLKTPATSIETCRELPLSARMDYQLAAVSAFFDEMHLGYEREDVPLLSPLDEPTRKSRPAVAPKLQNENNPVIRPSSSEDGLEVTPGPRRRHTLIRRQPLPLVPVVKVADSLELRVTNTQETSHGQFMWTSLLGLIIATLVFGCAIGSLAFYSLNFKKK